MARSPAFNTITRSGRPSSVMVAQPEPFDQLAAPTNDDLISGSLLFWPPGAAWGTPDETALDLSSFFARYMRVLISDFTWLYGRAWRLAREASLQGVVELLPQWEIDYGLPEQCFAGTEPSAAERIAALARKVRAEAVNHPEDFVQLAANYGFEIEIEEPAIFECGFSEVGGFHALGDWRQEVFWIVRVKDSSINYFEVGSSEVGTDPLFSLGEAERILCLLREMAPAWTMPVLQSWITLAALVTENGEYLVDEYGNRWRVTI